VKSIFAILSSNYGNIKVELKSSTSHGVRVWGVTEQWMQLRLIVRWSAQRPEFATDHGFRYHKGVAAQHIDVFMNEWR